MKKKTVLVSVCACVCAHHCRYQSASSMQKRMSVLVSQSFPFFYSLFTTFYISHWRPDTHARTMQRASVDASFCVYLHRSNWSVLHLSSWISHLTHIKREHHHCHHRHHYKQFKCRNTNSEQNWKNFLFESFAMMVTKERYLTCMCVWIAHSKETVFIKYYLALDTRQSRRQTHFIERACAKA